MQNQKIRVLHAIRQGKIGGGESHVIDLVESLDKDRYESIVLAFTDGPMIMHMEKLGIKSYVIHTEKPFDFSQWRAVRQLLEDESIDVVHAHGTRANSNTFYGARQLGIPVIYTVHGWSFHPDQHPVLKWLRIQGERFLVNKADLTVCVSDNNFNDASKLFPMQRATVVKYGINLKKFNPDQGFRNVKRDFGISDQTVVVGYVVRMTIQKDPLTLVRAIALLPQDMDVKFLFIGDGDLKAEAVELAKSLGISSKIIFEGFRQDVPAILNAIDIYCLPSLWEGLPIGMLEAMAMGKAVVTTTVDGAKEVIENGVNGLLVPTRSPDKLADALCSLISDAYLRTRLGDEARRTVVRGFNLENMTRNIEQLYDTSFNMCI